MTLQEHREYNETQWEVHCEQVRSDLRDGLMKKMIAEVRSGSTWDKVLKEVSKPHWFMYFDTYDMRKEFFRELTNIMANENQNT
jgi:hypothetical protein